MSKNKIKNITIIGEDSANISEGCVDVYVTLKNDERTYFLEFTTPQALTSEMVENKKGFVEPRFPFLIVQKLTPEIIREAIETFLVEDADGFWFKLYSSTQYLTTDNLDFVINRDQKEILREALEEN